LLGLATNLIRNHLRHCDRGQRAVELLEVGSSEDHADVAIGRAEASLLGPALAQALDGIPDGDRDALLLMAWNDLSYQEVAEALDIPVGTVRSRISRARLRLRARLSEMGYNREEPKTQPPH
jgi:RNA polymerase sigma factor (sigma-70 family)